jgi:hypothetical protein
MTVISTHIQNEATIDYAPSRSDILLVAMPGGPMLVSIDYVPDGNVVTEKKLGLFGEGKNLDRALDDLVKHMTLIMNDLEEHEDTLSQDLKSDLAALRYFLRK